MIDIKSTEVRLLKRAKRRYNFKKQKERNIKCF